MNLSMAQALSLLSGAEQVNSRDCPRAHERGGYHHKHKHLDDQILELRKSGLGRAETARRLGIHSNTVYKCMRHHGLVAKRSKR